MQFISQKIDGHLQLQTFCKRVSGLAARCEFLEGKGSNGLKYCFRSLVLFSYQMSSPSQLAYIQNNLLYQLCIHLNIQITILPLYFDIELTRKLSNRLMSLLQGTQIIVPSIQSFSASLCISYSKIILYFHKHFCSFVN